MMWIMKEPKTTIQPQPPSGGGGVESSSSSSTFLLQSPPWPAISGAGERELPQFCPVRWSFREASARTSTLSSPLVLLRYYYASLLLLRYCLDNLMPVASIDSQTKNTCQLLAILKVRTSPFATPDRLTARARRSSARRARPHPLSSSERAKQLISFFHRPRRRILFGCLRGCWLLRRSLALPRFSR